MSNVIEFKKPPKPKEKRKAQRAVRKAMVFAGVFLAFVVVWAYFAYLA